MKCNQCDVEMMRYADYWECPLCGRAVSDDDIEQFGYDENDPYAYTDVYPNPEGMPAQCLNCRESGNPNFNWPSCVDTCDEYEGDPDWDVEDL